MPTDLFESTDADRDAERARVEAADKRFATLAARFERAGYWLNVVDGDAPFRVTRWQRTHAFASLEGAEKFLADVTGKRWPEGR
jgi:hypothetical protein